MRIDPISSGVEGRASIVTPVFKPTAANQAIDFPVTLKRDAAANNLDPGSSQSDRDAVRFDPEQPTEEAQRLLDKSLEPLDIQLRFSRDAETEQIVVEMVDHTTGETLRQIPDETMLRVSATLGKLRGQVVDRQA